MRITSVYGNAVSKKAIFTACKDSDYLKNLENKTEEVQQIVFADNDDKNDVMILFCGEDYRPYGTISKACIQTIKDYVDFMGDELEFPFGVKVEKAVSRAGREYLKIKVV